MFEFRFSTMVEIDGRLVSIEFGQYTLPEGMETRSIRIGDTEVTSLGEYWLLPEREALPDNVRQAIALWLTPPSDPYQDSRVGWWLMYSHHGS